MTAENRVLALQLAMQTVLPESDAVSPVMKGSDVTAVASIYYAWLEGPAFLIMTTSELTVPQDAPDGPGVPTVMKGPNMAQITDLEQYTASVGETDSKQQPVTGDNLVWAVADATIASVTPSADGYSAVVAGVADGTTTYTVTDNTVTPPLVGTGSVTVVSSAATALTITEGTPEPQPAPPAGP